MEKLPAQRESRTPSAASQRPPRDRIKAPGSTREPPAFDLRHVPPFPPTREDSELRATIAARCQAVAPLAPAAALQKAQDGVRDPGEPLPHRAALQRAFGPFDLSSVRVHRGLAAREASDALSANAYTHGEHIALGQSPALRTVAHEAAHVVQQRQPGVSMRRGVSEPGDRVEHHADAVANRVVQGGSAVDLLSRMAPLGQLPGVAAPPVVLRDKMSAANAQQKISKRVNRHADLQGYLQQVLEKEANNNPAQAFKIFSWFLAYTPPKYNGGENYLYYQDAWIAAQATTNIGDYSEQYGSAAPSVAKKSMSNLAQIKANDEMAKFQGTRKQSFFQGASKIGLFVKNLGAMKSVNNFLVDNGNKYITPLLKNALAEKSDNQSEEVAEDSVHLHEDEVKNPPEKSDQNASNPFDVDYEPDPDDEVADEENSNPFAIDGYLSKQAENSFKSEKEGLIEKSMNVKDGLKGTAKSIGQNFLDAFYAAPLTIVKQLTKGASGMMQVSGAFIESSGKAAQAQSLYKQAQSLYANCDNMDELKDGMYDVENKELLLGAIQILVKFPWGGNVQTIVSNAANSGLDSSSFANFDSNLGYGADNALDAQDLAVDAEQGETKLSSELKKNAFWQHNVHDQVQKVKNLVGHSSEDKNTIASAIDHGLGSEYPVDRVIADRILSELLGVDEQTLKENKLSRDDPGAIGDWVRDVLLKG